MVNYSAFAGLSWSETADVVSSVLSHAYPELVARRDHIHKVISSEEERFLERLDQGTTMLQT